jgi:DNA-binding transcriptional MerR regulator
MVNDFSNIFFTADIATLLNVPEWRVMRFAQGEDFEITPSHKDASGSGTRRVYDIEDVCQIALALRLLDSGLGAKAIGAILRGLREKESLSAMLEWEKKKLEGLYLLVFRTPKSRKRAFSNRGRDAFFVNGLTEAQVEQAERPQDDLLLLSVGATFRDLKSRLTKLRKEKEK